MCGSRGGEGAGDPDPPPPEKHKNKGSLSNTGPDPLKNHKATKNSEYDQEIPQSQTADNPVASQHLMLGHHRHASETPFNGVLLACR